MSGLPSPTGFTQTTGMSVGLGFSLGYGLAFQGFTSFTPASLFANGEPGVWYDPSDLSTMFQDSAGTTPVTAVEQPVGLLLDKSKGLALGSELVTNGDFATDTWWAKSGTTISDGAANWSSAGANSWIGRTTALLTVGSVYQVEWTISSISAGGLRLHDGGSYWTTQTAPGTYTETFRAGGANFYIISTGASTTASVDNVSIKLISGTHASQSTAASRPVLSARVNLLTQTEDFSVAAWAKVGCTATGNKLVANNGVTLNSTSAYISQNVNVNSATTKLRLLAKSAGFNVLNLRIDNINALSSPASFARINLTTGDVISSTGGTFNVNPASDGYWEVTTDNTYTSTTYVGVWPDDTVETVGNGVDGVMLATADLRVTNVGSNMPAYQRVGAATYGTSTVAGNPDYDTTGFPLFLAFNGVTGSRSMVSSTITPGTDKAQVFAGVRKLSDASQQFISEFSSSSDALPGAFGLQNYTDQKYYWSSAGTIQRQSSSGAIPSPSTDVLTGIGDISGDNSVLRVNAASQAANNLDQGTGNYLAYPLYLGARAGTNLYYNGNLYELIVRFGPNLSESTIDQTEVWVGDKTGLNLSFATQQTIFDRFNATVLDRAGATILQRY